MVYGKWLDFYMHVVWRSRTNGVLQIWYRLDGQRKFTKLYWDVPGDRALIHVPAASDFALQHPKRSPRGRMGSPAWILEGGFYRANTPWTNKYWWNWNRRRQSGASIVAGFPHQTLHRRHPPRH